LSFRAALWFVRLCDADGSREADNQAFLVKRAIFFLRNNDFEITNPDPTWRILTLLSEKSGEKDVVKGEQSEGPAGFEEPLRRRGRITGLEGD
jgi:hypothetical protein